MGQGKVSPAPRGRWEQCQSWTLCPPHGQPKPKPTAAACPERLRPYGTDAWVTLTGQQPQGVRTADFTKNNDWDGHRWMLVSGERGGKSLLVILK